MNTPHQAIPVASIEHWSDHADVIVVGLGIAGACAALEARRAGADVLVIERASGGGGASALSSGIFYLGGGTAVGVPARCHRAFSIWGAAPRYNMPQAIRTRLTQCMTS